MYFHYSWYDQGVWLSGPKTFDRGCGTSTTPHPPRVSTHVHLPLGRALRSTRSDFSELPEAPYRRQPPARVSVKRCRRLRHRSYRALARCLWHRARWWPAKVRLLSLSTAARHRSLQPVVGSLLRGWPPSDRCPWPPGTVLDWDKFNDLSNRGLPMPIDWVPPPPPFGQE
jgi:hypothetical protein